MSASDEYTEEQRKTALIECANLVSEKEKEFEKAKKDFDDAYGNWKATREETLDKIGVVAESIKDSSDQMAPIQTFSKMASAAGKVAAVSDPTNAASVGALISLVGDAFYLACSIAEVGEQKRMRNDVQSILDKDKEESQRLYRVINEMRAIAEAVKECVKKFPPEMLKCCIPTVPRFVPSVSTIENISPNESDGIRKFLGVLLEEVKFLTTGSFPSLPTFNPAVVELLVTIPEIILDYRVLCSSVETTSPMGSAARPFNISAIIADLFAILEKLIQLNQYPKMSADLLEIKQKLQDEKDKIDEFAEEIERRAANARNE